MKKIERRMRIKWKKNKYKLDVALSLMAKCPKGEIKRMRGRVAGFCM